MSGWQLKHLLLCEAAVLLLDTDTEPYWCRDNNHTNCVVDIYCELWCVSVWNLYMVCTKAYYINNITLYIHTIIVMFMCPGENIFYICGAFKPAVWSRYRRRRLRGEYMYRKNNKFIVLVCNFNLHEAWRTIYTVRATYDEGFALVSWRTYIN